VLIFVVYKLADKWASKFLTSHVELTGVVVKQTGRWWNWCRCPGINIASRGN